MLTAYTPTVFIPNACFRYNIQ